MAHYCSYQDRCHQEVEEKMKEFVLIPEAHDEILLYLIKGNFLNEERFTRSYIRGKFYIKQWGKLKIRNRLRFKGISDKLISKCMNEINEDDYQKRIHTEIEKLLPRHKGLQFYQKKNKVIKHLLTKGFEYDQILNVFELLKI